MDFTHVLSCTWQFFAGLKRGLVIDDMFQWRDTIHALLLLFQVCVRERESLLLRLLGTGSLVCSLFALAFDHSFDQ